MLCLDGNLPPQLRSDWRVDFFASSDIAEDGLDSRRAIEEWRVDALVGQFSRRSDVEVVAR